MYSLLLVIFIYSCLKYLTDLNANDSEFTFPPIPICREDKQFLKEISVKIQMTDPKIVGICLTQLREEVLQDFPPEILLQKTDIFKVFNYYESLK